MRKSPLEDPRLSEIEAKLNSSSFDEAQRLLAALSDVPSADAATVYFATRLLFQRGRLDADGVVERLRDLLRDAGPFPEAERLLHAAEQGLLERAPESKRRAGTATPATERPKAAADDARGPASETPETLPQAIPRAPPLPRFTPNPRVPSYVPAPQISASARAPRHDPKAPTAPPPALHDTELSPPPPPPDPSRKPKSRSSSAERERPARRPSSGRSRRQERAKLPTIPELEVPSSRSSPTLRAATSSAPVPTETVPSPPPPSSIRSFSTIPTRSAAPNLFEIAEALDAGKPEEALELAARLDDRPELVLLRARARAQLGQGELAEVELEVLLRTPALEPALRTGAARLLIELGAPERALEQARAAFEEDPKDARNRVTCAWALLRMFRRSGEERLVTEAEPLLASVRLREKALVAVLSGLRALMAIERGDPRRALGLAQNALGHNPRQPDALVALAVASARLGLTTDAQRATDRLLVASPIEAEAARPLLAREGVELCRSEPPVRASEKRLIQIWGAVEAALVHGRREPAVLGFERACAECLRAAAPGKTSFPALAGAAAELFTKVEVLRHFAPYDRSLFSVERLAAAFDVLYGAEGGESAGDDAVIRLAGAYVGESLRQAFGGEWQGTPRTPAEARVEAIGLGARPHELVALRLRRGEPLAVRQPARLHPGADPLGNFVPLSLAPPCPWGAEPWPALAKLSELGRVLPDSIVGVYCAPHPEVRLDHSVSSSVGIDRYVALLAPAKAPSDPDAGWARRAAVLVGAYLGEVLVETAGARWDEKPDATGAEAYLLVMKDGSTATPVARALDRLAGRRGGPLSEYVTRLVSGRTSNRA